VLSIVPAPAWQYLGRSLTVQPPTRIQLCGPLVVAVDGERIESRLPSRQGQLLFAYLVLKRGDPVPRYELTEAVWPRGGPAAVDSALSALLSKLRAALPPLELEGRSEVRLQLPEGSFVDIEAAREAIHRAESAVATERWREAWAPSRIALHTANRGFLPGLDAPWIDEQRRDLEGIQVRALECVAATGLGMGGPELAAAERCGRQLIKLDPFLESGYICLIEALERRDNVAEALQVYERLRRLLRDELGIAPGGRAQEAHQRLIERRSP